MDNLSLVYQGSSWPLKRAGGGAGSSRDGRAGSVKWTALGGAEGLS